MKRPLTPEEKKLWEQVTAKTAPLSRKSAKVEKYEDAGKKKPGIKIRKEQRTPHVPASLYFHAPKTGAYANIDRNTADRFRKGNYPIDATLDLHGMSHDKAQAALHRFLHSHYERGSRCLLVVTGKGLVLRDALPRWLAESELHSVILTFDVAKQKHGGSGAYYVLLRRKRGKE